MNEIIFFLTMGAFAVWVFTAMQLEMRDLREERRKEYLERLERKWLGDD